MANIYCQSCGSKHNLGAKFCSSCGESFGQKVAKAQASPSQIARMDELDEDGIPNHVVIPDRLSYTIEKQNTKQTIAEALSRAPVDAGKDIKIDGYKKPSVKDFANESMKECGPKQSQEIDE